ncbi:membrane protein [Hydrogenophaga taeniospiralis CCUG 15921]|uniref:Membrane protein n=1 Tax=Hydrogenophaga taeniospiralis CCUG 15921 TaxID=1281780 RepID=A0A9X4NXC5_9BURK|nr:MgtC/SapB family protein [Hydrogenophaga taeniospiralis]MDG5977994.1 membrane protein [Hydrogenophaga taeniospiralis CCUG 15921]
MNGDELLPGAQGLVAALAVGLVIGLERGWHNRELPEGGRVAGLRTFALTGLLGGVLGHLQPDFGAWPLLGALLGLSLLLTVSYARRARLSGDLSATTPVAMLLTLALGAFAAHGNITLALSAAVIGAVLLDLKPTLHGWLRVIDHRELTASLQLLVLSMVILPYLPNTGLGPYGALNPYQLWWAVILIAGLSLTGHFAMRITGAQRGLLWTGILGGLASSTAATLALARYARQQPRLAGPAAAGSLAACGVMFFRMLVLLAVVQPSLLSTLGSSLVASGLVLLGVALWRWRKQAHTSVGEGAVDTMAPFDLGTALGFGALLAVMSVLVPAAKQWLDTSGLYVLSAVSGLVDVDAILISLARLHGTGGLSTVASVTALGLATLANMVTKIGIAWTTGGSQVGKPVFLGYLAALACGAIVLALSVALG